MRNKLFFLLTIILMSTHGFAQMPSTGSGTITGKYGTYYDQRELLFEAMPTSENDIIFLGNSITDGGEWAELFQNPNCKNRGISGDIIPGVLNRLETVTKGKPAMVFLMIGTNDMNWGYSNDTIALGVREIVQRIKKESPRTRIVVQSILPTNDYYGYFSGHTKRYADVPVINAMLEEMADEEDVEYLDLFSPFANEDGKLNIAYSNDGLHLNADGYLLWKDIIEDEIGRLPKPARQNKVPIWLNAGVGVGVANAYDQGIAPMSLLGVGVGGQLGVTVEWKRCHIQSETRGLFGLLVTGLSGYDIDGQERLEFLYRISDGKRNRLHVWAGGSLQQDAFFRIIPSLGNASTSTAVFFNLNAEGLIQYDFVPIQDHSRHLMTLYGKLVLPLGGLLYRPGFAFMDNYTSDINLVNTILSSYEASGMLFPGVSTDVGLRFNLPNGNKIGLSYRWDYLTTRNRGYYRFDNAFHTIAIDFMFKIN